jgi:pimeloyl-ACP methyl ester carboxylesterase
MSEELQAVFEEEAPEPHCSDREAVIEYIVEGERPFAGSAPFNEAALGAIAARALDGTTNLTSSITNHAAIDSGDGWRERVGEVSVPRLVIHGTEDPIYPYGNAGLRWGRRLLAPGCSLWSGWATRCLLALSGTLSRPPYCGTRGLRPEQSTTTAPGCHPELG